MSASAFRTVVLREDDPALGEILALPRVVVCDELAGQRAELAKVRPAVGEELIVEAPRWVWYPWRHTLVRLLGPAGFARLRTDRNRNKLTLADHRRLGAQRIGVVGLSVGHAIAHTLALEGLCGMLRLADFDTIELSNLNRIPATVLDLGVNKALVAARHIAELDPYLDIEVDTAGVTPETIGAFLDGLDIVIEECDSLDVKLLVREAARERRLPVLMETSDRGLLDVERFDLEPDRELFHGLLGDLRADQLTGLATRDKVPFVLRILEPAELSAPMAASMAEIDHEVTTWPQLGGDVTLGAATAAAAVRRIGRGLPLPSGRVRVDLDATLDQLGPPATVAANAATALRSPPASLDVAPADPAGASVLLKILAAACRAPSGGNAQPWTFSANEDEIVIRARPERGSRMDVAGRGTLVALGAACFNAQAAAAAFGLRAELEVLEQPEVSVRLTLTNRCADQELAAWYPAVLARHSNRQPGDGTRLDEGLAETLCGIAEGAGGWLGLLEGQGLLAASELLARADRIRFLDPDLHREMLSELRFPGDFEPDWGIDVDSLELDATDRAKLEVSRRRDVMDLMASWDGGVALGDLARDRVPTSSALAVLAIPVPIASGFLRGGELVQRIWITAQRAGLAVQPWSPVFLYSLDRADLASQVAPGYVEETADLAQRFWALTGLPDTMAPVLVLRLSTAPPPTTTSRREAPRWSPRPSS